MLEALRVLWRDGVPAFHAGTHNERLQRFNAPHAKHCDDLRERCCMKGEISVSKLFYRRTVCGWSLVPGHG